jgi:bifunctional non-homologous end joining protein LigD
MAALTQVIRIGRHEIEITRPTKLLFPADGITKGDLVEYYRRIAPWMLPHSRGRPLAMERYPDGIDKPSFFHKAVPSYYPAWIKTVTLKKAGGTVTQVVCDNQATLVFLANQACITPHVWLSRIDKLHYPDLMVFDLDPSGGDFGLVKSTAWAFQELLEDLGLPAYVKTTGSRGLHVAVPLKRQENFDSVREFARQVAEIVVNEDPQHRTLEHRKEKRHGRVFVDTNRNAYAQTIAPAYAVRARPHAPVSLPLNWNELNNEDLRPDGETITTVFERLEKAGDSWKGFRRHATSLNGAYRKLERRSGTRGIPQEEKVQ